MPYKGIQQLIIGLTLTRLIVESSSTVDPRAKQKKKWPADDNKRVA